MDHLHGADLVYRDRDAIEAGILHLLPVLTMMAAYLKRWFVFILLQGAVFAVWVLLARPAPNSYASAMNDKHRRLEELNGHRLIIVGGSNAAFGYDCRVVEQRLPLQPVNMALYAGFGIEFMCAEITPDVRQGDVVVLSLEYSGFEEQQAFDRQFWRTILFRPQCVREWLSADKKLLLDDGLGFLAAIGQYGWARLYNPDLTLPKRPYTRDSFDEYGDVVIHWQYKPGGPHERISLMAPTTREVMARRVAVVSKYVHEWERRGAKVVVDYPHIPQWEFARHRAQLDALDAEMRAALGDRVLLRVDDIPWPEGYFFDSAYHLRGPGMRRRATELANRLRHVGADVVQVQLGGQTSM
jgi:hypothetical protein